MKLNWRNFFSICLELINHRQVDPNSNPNDNQDREFRSQFGVSWFVCEDAWNLLQSKKPNKLRQPKHLLWALLFLKVYGNEKTHSVLACCDVKTFRKWSWNVLEDIAELDEIVVCIFYLLLLLCFLVF